MSTFVFLLLGFAVLGVAGVIGYAAYVLFVSRTGAEDFLRQEFDTELYEEEESHE